jgi:hypothetical protein
MIARSLQFDFFLSDRIFGVEDALSAVDENLDVQF